MLSKKKRMDEDEILQNKGSRYFDRLVRSKDRIMKESMPMPWLELKVHANAAISKKNKKIV